MAKNNDEKRLDGLLASVAELTGLSNLRHAPDPIADPDDKDLVNPADPDDESVLEEDDDIIDVEDPELEEEGIEPTPAETTEEPPESTPKPSTPAKAKPAKPPKSKSAKQPKQPDPTPELGDRLTELIDRTVAKAYDDAIAELESAIATLKKKRSATLRTKQESRQKAEPRPIVWTYIGKDDKPTHGEEYSSKEEIFEHSESVKTLMEIVDTTAVDRNAVIAKLFKRKLYYADEQGEPIRNESVSPADRDAFIAREKAASVKAKQAPAGNQSAGTTNSAKDGTPDTAKDGDGA